MLRFVPALALGMSVVHYSYISIAVERLVGRAYYILANLPLSTMKTANSIPNIARPLPKEARNAPIVPGVVVACVFGALKAEATDVSLVET